MNLFLLIGKLIASAGLIIASLFGYHEQQLLSAFNPSGGNTYRLQNSAGSSDTTLALASFKEPISNIAYTMSYLNSSIEYGTLEPGNQTNKEFISFTGITQNSDGSASLTGVVRGLGFSYPYTSSTTLQKTHSAQSIFILSNPPQLTNQYGNKNNDETISGIWNFTTAPIIFGSPTSTSQVATRGYADSLTISGAPTSTELIMGVSSISSQDQLSSGTASTTSGAPKVIPSRLATSSPQSNAGWIPTTDSTGKISSGFIPTSSSYNFTGTTRIKNLNASSTSANPITLNGVNYDTPSTQGASSTALFNNGSGGLKWIGVPYLLGASSSPNTSFLLGTTYYLPIATTTVNMPTAGNVFISANSLGSNDVAGHSCTVTVFQDNKDDALNSTYGFAYTSAQNISEKYNLNFTYSTTTTSGQHFFTLYGKQTNSAGSNCTILFGYLSVIYLGQ